MQDCIFCNIVVKKIPCHKIYEDNDFISFLDIFPRAKGHTLVIPKQHYRWVYDVSAFGAYWEVAKKVGFAVQNSTGADFISYLTVGEEVPHAHIHILPQTFHERKPGVTFGAVLTTSKEELEMLAQSISVLMSKISS